VFCCFALLWGGDLHGADRQSHSGGARRGGRCFLAERRNFGAGGWGVMVRSRGAGQADLEVASGRFAGGDRGRRFWHWPVYEAPRKTRVLGATTTRLLTCVAAMGARRSYELAPPSTRGASVRSAGARKEAEQWMAGARYSSIPGRSGASTPIWGAGCMRRPDSTNPQLVLFPADRSRWSPRFTDAAAQGPGPLCLLHFRRFPEARQGSEHRVLGERAVDAYVVPADCFVGDRQARKKKQR